MEYCLAIKKVWSNAVYSNVDGPRGYHTQWNRKEKTNICYLHVEPKEYNWWKQKGRLTDLENQLMVSSGERWGGNVRVGEREVQTTGCEVDSKGVFYNKRNIASIL